MIGSTSPSLHNITTERDQLIPSGQNFDCSHTSFVTIHVVQKVVCDTELTLTSNYYRTWSVRSLMPDVCRFGHTSFILHNVYISNESFLVTGLTFITILLQITWYASSLTDPTCMDVMCISPQNRTFHSCLFKTIPQQLKHLFFICTIIVHY